jgi:hypothetical protein
LVLHAATFRGGNPAGFALDGVGEEEKPFFFEKKKQKPFVHLVLVWR